MKNFKVIFVIFLAICIGMIVIGFIDNPIKKNTVELYPRTVDTAYIYKTDTIIIHHPCDTPQFHVVTGTKYQPVEAQCDATPLNTADGSFIDTTKLEIYDFRWCALSQDLLWFNGGPYHYGDFIRVYSPNEEYSGLWQVHDCMNKRYTNRIDFLTWFNWPTLGVQENIVIHLEE